MNTRDIDRAVAIEVLGLPEPSVPNWAKENYHPLIGRSRPLEGWLLTTTGYKEGDVPIVVPKRYSTDPLETSLLVQEMTKKLTPGGENLYLNTFTDGIVYSACWCAGSPYECMYTSEKSMMEAICMASINFVRSNKAVSKEQEPWISYVIKQGGREIRVGRPFKYNPIPRG